MMSWRVFEMILLFGGIPALIAQEWVPMWPALFAGLVYVLLQLWRDKSFLWRELFRWPPLGVGRRELWRVLAQFVVISFALVGMVLWLAPANFLNFPRDEPWIYLLVMVLYPLISVLPQELIFRVFFHRRYGAIVQSRALLILLSAVAFGWAHVGFGNGLALVLSTAAGLLFGLTWERTRTLPVVWIEHALYGNLVFTIGLGRYFYHAANHVA